MEHLRSDTMVADYINVEMYAGFGVFAGNDDWLGHLRDRER